MIIGVEFIQLICPKLDVGSNHPKAARSSDFEAKIMELMLLLVINKDLKPYLCMFTHANGLYQMNSDSGHFLRETSGTNE